MDPIFGRSFFQPSRGSNYYDDYPPRRADEWFFQPSLSPRYYHGYPQSNADAGYFRPSPSSPDYSDRFPCNCSDHSPPRETASPNVVRVPVHFVQADKTQTEKKLLRASSAVLTIQRVYRGHLVRKSSNKIASIKREVDEIERFLSQEDNIELIKRDGKEKLRVTETLMSLLLKLDSVRGVDCGVRELRKAVIKKVIRLQESLDDAVSVTVPTEGTPLTNSDEPAEEICEANNEKANSESITESVCSNCSEEDREGVPLADNGEREAANEAELTQAEERNQREMTQSDNSAVEENEKQVSSPNEENRSTPADSAEEEEMADWKEVTSLLPSAEDERKRKEGNKEELSLLLEENEKMRGLIAELVEKNEVQTQLLMSLFNRVDRLERAFVCDVLRRKKKKCGNNAVVGLASR